MNNYAIVRKSNGALVAHLDWHPDAVAFLSADTKESAIKKYQRNAR